MQLVYKERPQQDDPSFNMLLLIHTSLTTYQPYGVNFGLNTLINANSEIGHDKALWSIHPKLTKQEPTTTS